MREKIGDQAVTLLPDGRWNCAFQKEGINVTVSVRIGMDWWEHLGQSNGTYIEICIALIRACVAFGDADTSPFEYTISDLSHIVSTDAVPDGYNVSLIQREQLSWLFFLARHFCDGLS